jgi:hypothetical protein
MVESTRAEWSKLYQPDPGWLEKIGTPPAFPGNHIDVFPGINTTTRDLNGKEL